MTLIGGYFGVISLLIWGPPLKDPFSSDGKYWRDKDKPLVF